MSTSSSATAGRTLRRRIRHIHIRPSRVLLYVFIIAMVAFTALPLWYMIVQSFKPLEEIFAYPPRFYVKNPTLSNFTELLTAISSSSVPFTRYFFNSLLVTVASTVMSLFVCSLATFAMTKMKLPFKNGIFNFIVAAMAFSAPASQVTTYIIVNGMGMMNTYWALIIPKIATAMYFFLMKQNMETIPDALIESARLDGCNNFKIYWRIILPLSIPVLATVIVFAFVASWNDYYSPLIYINKDVLKTLPLALNMLQGGAGQVARAGAMAAATMITTLPTIIVFTACQSKVTKTMAHSGIK